MDPRRLAVVPLVVSVPATVATVWLDVVAPADGPGVRLTDGVGWPYAVQGLVLSALATIVLRHAPRHRFGVLLAVMGVCWTFDGLAQAYVRVGLTADDAWPGMTFVAWYLFRFTAVFPVLVGVLVLLYPTGRFLPGAWGVLSRACVTVMGVSVLAALVLPSGSFDPGDVPPHLDLDPTTLGFLGDRPALFRTLVVASVVAFALGLGPVVARYRRSTGLGRARMRWLAWGVLVVVIVGALAVLLEVRGIGLVATSLAMTLPAAAMTVGVVDPRRLPVEDLLVRTLAAGGVLAAVVAADLAAVSTLTALLGGALDERQVVVVVLLLSVTLYGPLRARLQAWARRLVVGRQGDPYDVVAGLASALETAPDERAQLDAVAEAVAGAFGVGFVSVEVDRGEGERLVATRGERPERTRTRPVTYRGEEVGRLVLPASGVRSRLSARDERLLDDLVRQAATAVRTRRLADDLQQSREQLVLAREEERRRIRRDLHDGLGPSLGGVVFRLESARLMLGSDPAAVDAHLVTTRALVQDVVAEVRRVAHDLRPPALDDRGLVGALRQLADATAVDVEVRAGDLPDLPAAVEVAAYRVAAEAIANVVRHAEARTCVVTLEASDELLVEVRDDGVGVGPDVTAGVGMVALRERAAELGGRSEVVCPSSGGTVVRACLPLRRDA